MNVCANCNSEVLSAGGEHDLSLTQFTSYDEGYEIQVSNSTALSTIFEHSSLLKKECEQVADVVHMCLSCTTILGELYRFYLEFMKLTKETSYVQSMLKNSILWEHEGKPKPPFSYPPGAEDEDGLLSTSKLEVTLKVEENSIPTPDDVEDQQLDDSFLENSPAEPPSPLIHTRRSKRKGYECQICTASFRTQVQLKYHKSSAHGRGRERPEQSTQQRRRGAKANNKSKPATSPTTTHECKVCAIKFSTCDKLQHHRRVFHSKRSYPCPECSKAFRVESRLNWHLVVAHQLGERLKDRDCPLCSKYFDLPGKMKAHLKARHAELPPPAEGKQQRPSSSSSSSSDQLFKCEHCGKDLKTKGGLKEHVEQLHLNPKVYACPVCGKTSNRREFLTKHMPMHDESREKNIKCSLCEKTFYRLKSLRRHEKVHETAGSKTYVCTECGDKFAQQTGLRRHVLAKHLEDKGAYICEICGKGFKIREYLTQHMRSKTHGGKGHGLYTPAGRRRLEREQKQGGGETTTETEPEPSSGVGVPAAEGTSLPFLVLRTPREDQTQLMPMPLAAAAVGVGQQPGGPSLSLLPLEPPPRTTGRTGTNQLSQQQEQYSEFNAFIT